MCAGITLIQLVSTLKLFVRTQKSRSLVVSGLIFQDKMVKNLPVSFVLLWNDSNDNNSNDNNSNDNNSNNNNITMI